MSAVPAPPGSGGGSGVTLEQLQTEASTPAEVQAVVEAALAAITPPVLESEVRMFSGDLPDGWTQVQGPVLDLAAGDVILIPSSRIALQAAGGPSAPYNVAAVTTEGGKLFVYVSNPFEVSGGVASYDPATNLWTGLSAVGAVNAEGPVVGMGDGRLFVLYGVTINTETYEEQYPFALRFYNTETNAWSVGADPLHARGSCAAVRLSSGKILVFGRSALPTVAAIDEYDPATNSWSTKTSEWNYPSTHGCLLPSGNVLMFSTVGPMVYAVYDPIADDFVVEPTELPFESEYSVSLVAGATGPVLYLADASIVAAFNTETNTWSAPLDTMCPSTGGPKRSAYLAGYGAYFIDASRSSQWIPEGSMPNPIRYASKD